MRFESESCTAFPCSGVADPGVQPGVHDVDDEIGEIIGAHMIGSEVTELLGELSMAKLLEGTSTELGWLVRPHPTISEIVKEAALDTMGEAIHI